MHMHVAPAGSPFVHVVGPDLDKSMLSSLHVGDQILVEINGQRLFTDIPIAAEQPWEVTETSDECIKIYHPSSANTQVLHFADIIPSSEGPAVFLLRGTLPNLPVIYVILQLISHKSDRKGLHANKYRWQFNAEAYSELFSDPIIKRGLLEKWCGFFKTFNERGWGYKSYKRFALRAGIKTDTIRAFISSYWEEIEMLPDEVLLDIARQLELLPTFLELSNEIQHDFNRTVKK
jgi:hypothetical protein